MFHSNSIIASTISCQVIYFFILLALWCKHTKGLMVTCTNNHKVHYIHRQIRHLTHIQVASYYKWFKLDVGSFD